jgi:arabinofuranan 3-O-arabinosyltransferase
MNFVRRTARYIFSTRDYFNSSIVGNGIYYGLPMWLILVLRIVFALRSWKPVAAVPPRRERTRRMLTSSGVADRVVPGAVADRRTTHDAVPVPDDGGAAELGAAQLGRVAGDLRFMTMDRWLFIYWVPRVAIWST